MAAANPWVVTDQACGTARSVAARQLRKRLRAVWKGLRAACRVRHEPKSLHQLRVATRRTIAAFEAFEELVPGKKGRWFAKRLRRIRRAAGETRDLDVLIPRLLANEPRQLAAGDARSWSQLLSRLRKRHERSRRPLRKLCSKLERDDWPGRVERLLKRVLAAETDESYADFARRGLPPVLERFFAQADRRLVAAEAVHQLRIEGKRLRYAIEVLGVALPRTVATAGLAALEEMQESLGAFVDHAAAADRFRRLAREATGADRRLLADLASQEQGLADTARKAFARWWTAARRRSLRQRFEPQPRRGSRV
ncbi:MAG: hypothetical protein RLZZ440_1575 [Planctomycetota bacterium]